MRTVLLYRVCSLATLDEASIVCVLYASVCLPLCGAFGASRLLRWATLMAHRLLTSHEPELASIMKAFREGKPVSECVAALEGARS